MHKDLTYYKALPYGRPVDRLERDDGSVYYVAWIREIPWVTTHGADPEEARAKLAELFEDAIEALIESGDEIPESTLWPATVGEVRVQDTSTATQGEAATATVDDLQEASGPWTQLSSNLQTVGA